ncbi:MAG: PAS domain-containing sensor histidine kinase [Melioribacteraceae bacterium]|nr:MAG: PAS domain-containing sensor histidine kinase [Melioribacteraceae bacterium]
MDLQIEKRYERLINFLTDYIYTVKIDDGKVVDTFHGPGCVNVTGYNSEDYKSDPELWYRMVHEKDSKKVLDQARRALVGEDVEPVEHRIIHRDGSIRWVRNSIIITRDHLGKPIYYDGLINDITNLKAAEKEAEIRQQQLLQADKMASLGVLISGIAHEINNPNNFILLNIQLFQKIWKDVLPILEDYFKENGDFVLAGMLYSRASSKINQSLEGILNGSERIRKIVNTLTDYAKIDSGQIESDVDINKIVDMAITITSNLIKQSTNNFKVELDSSLPTIKGNSQQLEQVVINLLTNACHSLKKKDSSINLRTELSDDKKSIRIVVKDKGRGIKEKDLKHIMDPFFTTRRDSGGTGLGLSISYNIVKNHGGELSLLSDFGKGTTATVTLPVDK